MIRKNIILLIVVLLTVILASSLFASNGTQIGTVGARSTAMGSNFRGLADDWSAVFYNPAGITQLGKWTFSVSSGLIMPLGNYTPYNYPYAPTAETPTIPFPGMNTDQCDLVEKTFIVPAMAAIYNPSEKLSLGLAFYAPYGLGAEFDLLNVPDGYGNTNAISKENEHFSDHQVINIQPTIAYKITKNLSVGLGLSYIWGKMAIDQIKLPPNPLMAVWADPSYALLTAALGPINTDQSCLIIENNLSGDGSAYGINLGILLDINNKLSVGLSGRYSTDLKLAGTMKQIYALPGDPAKYTAITSTPAAFFPGGETQQQELAAMFSGQNDETIYKVAADLPLPWTMGIGIAFKPSPKLTLTADASLTNWSSWGDIEVRVENGDDETMKQNWENTVEIGAGVEFLAYDNGKKQLFLRGGFYTVDSPVPDETMNPTLLDPNRRNVITGGVGLKLGKIILNVAYEYVLIGEKEIPESDYVFDDRSIAENYAGIYNMNANVVTIGTSIIM
jgi:long-chain fatty acid transport protein